MFHPQRNNELLEIVTQLLIQNSPTDDKGRAVFKPGFHLERHSIDQVIQANAHFDKVRPKLASGERKLNFEEIRWIRNERAICRIDFLYWATRYGFILDWTGNLCRFNPNLPQKIILQVMGQMELEDVAILLQILKARQEGVTTLSQLIILWRAMWVPYTTALIASSRPDKSAEMLKKLDTCFLQQPFWMVPNLITNNVDQKGFDEQNSFINIRHGAMLSDMGRGGTTTTFHLSEVAEFTNPYEAIDAALLRAAHDSPWLLGIMESTGNGRNGYWYSKWQYNVQYFPLKQSRLCPIFLPWYILRDIYPTDAWIRAHPIVPNWEPEDRTKAHAEKAQAYVQSGQNQLVTQTLGSNWEMPAEQMYFWQVTRQEYAADGKLHLFYQELCADDKEAFQSPNAQVFDSELVYEIQDKAPMPYGVYGLLAPQSEVPAILQPNRRDIDPNVPFIDIHCDWNPTGPSHDYRLVPLLHRGTAPFDPNGKVIIYEKPQSGYIYGIGTDTGYGIGKDRSVLEGIRKATMESGVKQVFEFASANVNSFSLWPFNLALGTLYASFVNGRSRQPRQVIEGQANGENVFNELKKRGWREFHPWLRYDRKRVIESDANRQLWYTTSWSRPQMMDMFLDAINNGWLEVCSPWIIEEMKDLELNFEKQKIMAAVGKHDDRIMAMCMVLYSLHIMETRHMDGWTARQTASGVPGPSYAKYSPGVQGRADGYALYGPPASYNYRVIRDTNPDAEILKQGGARIWTPNDEGR